MDLNILYKKICERGQVRILPKDVYIEKHHIIPRCMGGDNNKQNITTLTAREHFICHKILCKIYPKNEKLRLAFWGMCNQKTNRDYSVSSRDYQYAKELCLEIWKKPKSIEWVNKSKEIRRIRSMERKMRGEKINREQNGELNHNYNKKWITNIETNECKMIKGNIPDGWKLGRVKVGSLGKSNSTGRVWYHNSDGKEKYFKKNDIIPDGWIRGRFRNKKKRYL